MTISILGCGWFGTALSKTLKTQNHRVKGSTTTPNKIDDTRTHLIRLETAENSEVDPNFFDCDLLVVSNNVRMTDEQAYLQRIAYTIELIKLHGIPQVIFISSTSVYGEPNAMVDETSTPEPETLSAKLLLRAEHLFQSEAFSTTIIRFAGLIGPGRDPGRFFAGKTNVPNGLAPVNLLHLEDAVGITQQVIGSPPYPRIINAVNPDHPTRMDFYTQAARQSNLPLPHFQVEKTQWKMVRSDFAGHHYQHNLLP
jgi:nucleoside-diphosphate-sugar epimerase